MRRDTLPNARFLRLTFTQRHKTITHSERVVVWIDDHRERRSLEPKHVGIPTGGRIRAALPDVKIYGEPAPPTRRYSIKTKFSVGDSLMHPTFGIGEVRALLADNKIEVTFRDGDKVLIHNRK